MRAVVIHEHGGRDKLLLEQIVDPEPGPGEVRIAVKACGLNYLDVFVRRGMPGVKTQLPRITGGDVAGVVDLLGPQVVGAIPGQRVLIDPIVKLPNGHIGALGEDTTGGLAEYIVVPAENLITLPDSISFTQAAALPIAYGTAWRMLITRGQIHPGEHVLILGASGGVGTGCVQIAHMIGCVVYAAASTSDKLAQLAAIGADYGINYSEEPDFHRKVRAISPEGVDVVVNFTGGDSWVRGLKSVKLGGRVLTCGATAGYDPQTDIRYIWRKEIDIRGSDGWRREDLLALLQAVEAHRIIPVIDRVLPLEDVAEGHRLLEEREVFGKVIIQP